jgi:hypothetical protein
MLPNLSAHLLKSSRYPTQSAGGRRPWLSMKHLSTRAGPSSGHCSRQLSMITQACAQEPSR